jgi:ABC-type antimicrobial peptide transport system permease subunit
LVNSAAKVVAGFTLPLVFPVALFLWSIPAVVAVAVIAAWFPARSASRLNVVEAIGYE